MQLDEDFDPIEEPKSNRTVAVVVAIGAVAAIGFLLFRPAPAPAPAPAAPAVVQAPAPDPAPPPPPEVQQDEVKNALLGLDKKEESGGIAAMAQRAHTRHVVKPRVRRVAKEEQEADEQEDQELSELYEKGLSDATFHETMEKWRGVKSCLASETKKKELSKGALKISLKITDQGEVIDSRVSEPSNKIAKAIAPCVERSARALRFPAFQGDERFVVKQAKFLF